MTPDRKALARLIDPWAFDVIPGGLREIMRRDLALHSADRIITAGWTPPVVVTETPSDAQQAPLSPVDAQQNPSPVTDEMVEIGLAAQFGALSWAQVQKVEAQADACRADMRRALEAVYAADEVMDIGGRPISEAPQDGSHVLVWADPREGLPGFFTLAAYHPDAGWCVDELREAMQWWPINLPDASQRVEAPHPEPSRWDQIVHVYGVEALAPAIQGEAFERAARIAEGWHAPAYGIACAIRALSPLPTGSRVVVIPAEEDARASLEFDLQVKVSLAMKPHIPTVPLRLRHALAEAAVSAALRALTEGEKP